MLVDTLTVALPHIRSGRLRALGVTSLQPWFAAPEAPTVASVLPDFEVRSWLGVAAPAGTPADVMQRLNAALKKALENPELVASLRNAGSEPTYSTPEAMREMVARDIERWKGVIERRGIQVEG